jgi:tRNA(Ile)-lysidine synthase
MDSVALLYMMAEMCIKEGVRLGACYVDHKLRESAKNESHFVDKICHDLGVEFYMAEFTDDFWDDNKSNFEEKARIERYRLLFECAEVNGFQQIATAHHLDDQVETILMRIFDRGTGVKGLAGIKPTGEHMGSPLHHSTIPPLHHSTVTRHPSPVTHHASRITIIRPLLHMTRKEIEKFMEGKEFMTDESNSDTKIRRNYYRSVVIPAIESSLKSDEFKKRIAKLSENAQRETEFAEVMAREFWGAMGEHTGSPLHSSPVTHHASPITIPRSTIEKYSDNFWLTAFSYLFSQYRDFSHSTDTLIDIVKFIRKKEPATANYHPFVFERDRDGVRVVNRETVNREP